MFFYAIAITRHKEQMTARNGATGVGLQHSERRPCGQRGRNNGHATTTMKTAAMSR